MALPKFDILQKPPPDDDKKGWYRWYYRVCEILNNLPYVTTKDDGVTLSTATSTIDFTGAGVTATAVGDTITVNIPGGGGGGGTGDVVGPASAVNNNFAAFDTTTGKLIKDSGASTASFDAAGTTAAHALLTVAHGATGAVVGTTNVQALTNKTLNSSTNYIDADALHEQVYNNSGGVLTIGQAVVNTQWNVPNNAPEVIKARANSSTTAPCHGLVEDASIANGAVGSTRTSGILNNCDTSIWSDGVDLWLSPTTAGVLTSTEPTTVGQIKQFVGTVVRQHATLGIINVQLGPPITITAAGATTITQTEVDFGATPISDKEFTITDAAVTVASKIIVSPAYEDTTDNTADEIIANGVICSAGKPAAGSFTLTVASTTDMLSGKYKFNYVVG